MSLWGDEHFHFLNGFMSFFLQIFTQFTNFTLSHTGTSLLSRKTGCCIFGHIINTLQNQMHRYKEQWLILHYQTYISIGPFIPLSPSSQTLASKKQGCIAQKRFSLSSFKRQHFMSLNRRSYNMCYLLCLL